MGGEKVFNLKHLGEKKVIKLNIKQKKYRKNPI